MKKLLPQIGLLFLLLLPLLGRGQEVRISGRVVDAATKKPMPFVSVSLLEADTGTLTDESGYFHFATFSRPVRDSLITVTLGYKPKIELFEITKSTDLVIELTAAGLSTSAKLELPVLSGLPGQYAFYFNRNTQEKYGKLTAVSFYTGHRGLPREEFRLRLCKLYGPNHSPKTDLLIDAIILDKLKNNAWNSVDLSGYNIYIPDEGFYLVLEYLAGSGGPNHVSYLDSLPSADIILRPLVAVKECGMWVKVSGHWDYSKGKGGTYISYDWTLQPIECGELKRLANSIRICVSSSK